MTQTTECDSVPTQSDCAGPAADECCSYQAIRSNYPLKRSRISLTWRRSCSESSSLPGALSITRPHGNSYAFIPRLRSSTFVAYRLSLSPLRMRSTSRSASVSSVTLDGPYPVEQTGCKLRRWSNTPSNARVRCL